ncbi:hypothetical protein ACQRB4_02205 [Peptoniphilaceae bacterium SGI.097]|nr:hypothetical protein [Peptoniphilaceae bacterium]
MAKFTITLEGDEPQEKEQLLEFAHSLSDQEKKSFLSFLNGIQFAMQGNLKQRKRA